MRDMTGLSILIPVHDRAVLPLVRQLLGQVGAWDGPVEICCLDDASAPAWQVQNRAALEPLAGVRYAELPRNVGRAAIRNQLATTARHEWLLLLDNDSLLPDAHFLARYAAARGAAPVLSGGTTYEPVPPADAALRLRWLYGCQREARPAASRQQQPYSQLTINNLLVQAEVFRRFALDERLTRYGHEDTKFGWLLRQANVSVLHLNNPVLHDGLEPAAIFLAKTHAAVRNLAQLHQAEGLGADSLLVQMALRLKRARMAGLFQVLFRPMQGFIRRRLLSNRPSLRLLDVLKLYWLLCEWRGKELGRSI